MIPRYSTNEMLEIWSDEKRFENWFKVEMASVKALEALDEIPAGTFKSLIEKSKKINWSDFSKRALEIEKTTHHDVIAFLTALEEILGEESRWIHLGMTSSDIVDTAFAMQLVEATKQLHGRMKDFTDSLYVLARKHKKTVCLGRTHGQAAEASTFGLKVLSFAVEMKRNLERLKLAGDEIHHGKLSGAVGNYGNISPKVEALAFKDLGLHIETVSTQVVPRDRHAVFFSTLAIIGGCLERLSVEIRHLMRTEVSECFEPFRKGQKGSSAMPHKKNPILTENVTGLARLLRGYAAAALENQALWHERDISHSSVERVIAPDATTVLDFALKRLNGVISDLVVDEKKMKKNLDETGGLIFSEGVLLALAKKGVLRQKAYVWVQESAMSARQGDGDFKSNLKQNKDILKFLSRAEVEKIFDIDHHLQHVDTIFARA